MNNNEKTGIILLSGGLDSLVSLALAKDKCKIKYAINIDYGQKPYKEENQASREICKLYDIELIEIKLPFLEEICKNNDNFEDFKSVWVPNRNGLFINIAGVFCDKYDIDYIIFGANKEEARNFSDNSIEFIDATNKMLEFSTQKHPKVVAPCCNFTKVDIVNAAIERNLPLKLIKSCYNSGEKKHCGKCMSCKLLYNAIMNSKKPELIKEIF
ncbi:7-cyano-7-deazaguanine synthase [bacterium]|nr:7-cyano-7-deazaguanine synthase [bacterium]